MGDKGIPAAISISSPPLAMVQTMLSYAPH
jgi:hypothetical protein